jgi:hypothetical protein
VQEPGNGEVELRSTVLINSCGRRGNLVPGGSDWGSRQGFQYESGKWTQAGHCYSEISDSLNVLMDFHHQYSGVRRCCDEWQALAMP